MMKKGFCFFVAFVFLVSMASGCASEKSTLEKIKEKGVLVMGTSADYEPYEYHKMVDGEDMIVGFDIEIAKYIADKLGVVLQIEEMDFDGLLPALVTGKIDMVIAGMNPDEERKKSVDFSDIYYEAVQSILSTAENADKFTTVESFDGVKVGAQKGSMQEKMATEQLKGATVESLSKVPDLVLSLQYGKTEAVVLEGPVAKKYEQADPTLKVTSVVFPDDDTEGSAIAFRKGSSDFVDTVNSILKEMKENGTMDQYELDAFAAE